MGRRAMHTTSAGVDHGMIEVRLSSNDLRWAREAGQARIDNAVGKPKWAYKDGRSGVDTHTIGAAAELAFCRALGLVWPARVGVGHLLPDVDPFWEVRWSGQPRVPVKTNDRADQMVALVHGKMPVFTIVGYIMAGGAQKAIPLTDPGNRKNPAHFVEERTLVPINHDYHAMCRYLRAEQDEVYIPAKKNTAARVATRWRMVQQGGEWICCVCGGKEVQSGPG